MRVLLIITREIL